MCRMYDENRKIPKILLVCKIGLVQILVLYHLILLFCKKPQSKEYLSLNSGINLNIFQDAKNKKIIIFELLITIIS